MYPLLAQTYFIWDMGLKNLHNFSFLIYNGNIEHIFELFQSKMSTRSSSSLAAHVQLWESVTLWIVTEHSLELFPEYSMTDPCKKIKFVKLILNMGYASQIKSPQFKSISAIAGIQTRDNPLRMRKSWCSNPLCYGALFSLCTFEDFFWRLFFGNVSGLNF